MMILARITNTLFTDKFSEVLPISLVAICILLSLFTVGLVSAVMDLLAFSILISYLIKKKTHSKS